MKEKEKDLKTQNNKMSEKGEIKVEVKYNSTCL